MNEAMLTLGFRKPLVAAVVRRGLTPIVVTDRLKSPPSDGEYHLVPSLEDGMAVLRTALAPREGHIVGATTGHEQGVFGLACVRNALALPASFSLATAMRFRDKHLQKTSLAPQVPRPDSFYLEVSSYARVEHLVGRGQPVIIKPATGASTIDTFKVNDLQEFEAVLPSIQASNAKFVVEHFSSGEEYDADGWFQNGRLMWFSVARYLAPMLDSKVGKTMAILFLRRQDHPDLYSKVEMFLNEALKSLDVPNTVFHCEMFVHEDQIIFGECAVRPGGAFIPETLDRMYGVNLFDVSVQLGVGDTSQAGTLLPDMNYGIVLLRPPTDPERTRLAPDDFIRQFSFEDFHYEPSAFTPGYSSIARIGHAIVKDADEESLLSKMTQIIKFGESGYVG